LITAGEQRALEVQGSKTLALRANFKKTFTFKKLTFHRLIDW
jgi:hypothetical protein